MKGYYKNKVLKLFLFLLINSISLLSCNHVKVDGVIVSKSCIDEHVSVTSVCTKGAIYVIPYRVPAKYYLCVQQQNGKIKKVFIDFEKYSKYKVGDIFTE